MGPMVNVTIKKVPAMCLVKSARLLSLVSQPLLSSWNTHLLDTSGEQFPVAEVSRESCS